MRSGVAPQSYRRERNQITPDTKHTRRGTRDDTQFTFLPWLPSRSFVGAQVSASAFPRAERIRVAPVASTHAQLAASTRAWLRASIPRAAWLRAWARVSLPASIQRAVLPLP
jgi:hypothetical protein